MKFNADYLQYAYDRLKDKHKEISSFFLVYPYLEGKRVLDVGCSDGLYLRYFGLGSVGIEQVPELAAKARHLGMDVMEGDVPSILPSIASGSYPAVFFSHVLEHLNAPLIALQEIQRVLEPGGILILGLPTEKNFFRFAFNRDYFDGTHLYAFSVRNAMKLLAYSGFKPLKTFYDLPKCRGWGGKLIIRCYQHFPMKECISMAYWVVAQKAW